MNCTEWPLAPLCVGRPMAATSPTPSICYTRQTFELDR